MQAATSVRKAQIQALKSRLRATSTATPLTSSTSSIVAEATRQYIEQTTSFRTRLNNHFCKDGKSIDYISLFVLQSDFRAQRIRGQRSSINSDVRLLTTAVAPFQPSATYMPEPAALRPSSLLFISLSDPTVSGIWANNHFPK